MEAVGAASSILAIVEIGGKIGLLCAKYIKEVREAQEDAGRILKETQTFNTLLHEVENLLNGPFAAKLNASQALKDALSESRNVLLSLQGDLERGLREADDNGPKKPSLLKKISKGFKSGSLKWPFKKKDVEKILGNLRAVNSTITLALQIDNFSMVALRDQRINLEKLPAVKEAIFGSLEDQYEPLCLPDTRIEVLKSIEEWTKGPREKDTCIFWLRGLAGTGKSTIARSVASYLKSNNHLGASFFFKRSLAQRSSASNVLPTFAYSLAQHIPDLVRYINAAIDKDPAVFGKAYKEQFEKLIYEPLSNMGTTHSSTVVIVMDALDECEKEEDIILILSHLGRLKGLKSVDLRLFLTSRPEFGLLSGFQELAKDGIRTHDLVLHEVAKDTVNRDISIFFKQRFVEIQRSHSNKLPGSWPGQDVIQQLAKIAEPLFISAATICRFVDDKHFSPAKRLDTILNSPHKAASSVYQIYMTVFSQIVANLEGMCSDDRETVLDETRMVISTIVMLEAPIPRVSLSELIGMEDEVVDYRLNPLHSILSIPSDPDLPIQTFHLSFRDFLVDPQQKSAFSVNEKEVHERIAEQCIVLLSRSLKTNICGLQSPGTLASDINASTIRQCFPPELAYACQYWAYHLRMSQRKPEQNGSLEKFLREHLLHWLEATSILSISWGNMYIVNDLQSMMIDEEKPSPLSEFLRDISRFISYNQSVIAEAPLQVYCSALLFSPDKSVVKTIFSPKHLGWIGIAPSVPTAWSALKQTLEVRDFSVNCVAFSLDGKRIVSGSSTCVKIWDAVSGVLIQTLDCGERAKLLALSPNGKYLASVSASVSDDTIRIWDALSGILQHSRQEKRSKPSLHGSSDTRILVFSRDSELLVWGNDSTVFILNPTTARAVQTLKEKDGYNFVRCSSDCRRIITINNHGMIKVWDSISGTVLKVLADAQRYQDPHRTFGAFSPDDNTITLICQDGKIKAWDTKSLDLISEVDISPKNLSATDSIFLSNGRSLASVEMGSGDIGNISIFDMESLEVKCVLTAPKVNGQVFEHLTSSPDGKLLAAVSNQTIYLWDVTSGRLAQVLEGHSELINSVIFSPDGKLLVSAGYDEFVRLWELGSEVFEKSKHTYDEQQSIFPCIVTSPDEKSLVRINQSARRDQISSLPDGTVLAIREANGMLVLENAQTGTLFQTIGEKKLQPQDFRPFDDSATWSRDGKHFAVSFDDRVIVLWTLNPNREHDPRAYVPARKLEAHKTTIRALAFSLDSVILASASEDEEIRIWEVESGRLLRTFETGTRVARMAFSPNGKWLAAVSFLWFNIVVRIWDTNSGTLLKSIDWDTNEVYFSKDGTFLESDTGQLDVSDLSSNSSSAANSQNLYCLHGKFSYKPDAEPEWLSRNGENILRFPTQYRPNELRVCGDRLFFRYSIGYIGTLEFDAKGPPNPFTDCYKI
ncbi:hypothetical protein AA313_de0203191 [Arthrobotrys entomopaga]|nr:hypothetical protein AA313_de0203191 [Arthrobotrys entomopaga]